MGSHPNTEEIIEFVEQPEMDKFKNLRMHLVQCEDCRKKVQSISRVINKFPEAIKNIKNELVELPDELLALLDSAVYSGNPEAVQRYLAENPEYSKNALIYLQNAQQMQNHFSVNSQDVFDSDAKNAEKRGSQNMLQKLSNLFNFRWPVWINVPITAAAVAVLSVTVLMPDNETIISYQDSPFLEISQAQRPGMGFFANAEKERIKFDEVVVKLGSDGDVDLSWPEIDKATVYNVNITVMKDNTKQQIYHVATNNNHVVVKKGSLVNNRRIEWRLSGVTSDGRNFSASGGFVLQQ